MSTRSVSEPSSRAQTIEYTSSHYYIGFDDQEKGKYCILHVEGATDKILVRGLDSIKAARDEAKRLNIKLSANPYLNRNSRK